MLFRWILLLVVLLFTGCNAAKPADEWVEVPATNKDERPEPLDHDVIDAKFAALTNLYQRRPGSKARPTTSPSMVRKEDEIELSDLGLVLRRVKLYRPIDGQAAIFFSETEITNQMYAAYLNETNRFRDDTMVKRAADGEFTQNGNGFVSSTGWPSIHLEDPATMWHGGRFPEDHGIHPVGCLTMDDATGFCQWLKSRYALRGTVRLPTEAEWLSAAYGADRKYPLGNEEKVWTGDSTEPVRARPELRTPDGLFGMWGNVSELILSPLSGYGGEIEDKYSPIITKWVGPSYVSSEAAEPRQSYWGYTHSSNSRSDQWGFRLVFVAGE